MWIKSLWAKFVAWVNGIDASWDEEMANASRKEPKDLAGCST